MANLFGILSKRMNKNYIFRNKEELWDQIQKTWNELNNNKVYFENLCLSMPDRYREVIERNGCATHY